MSQVERIDVSSTLLDIWNDRSITTRQNKPGPPERIDGYTVGVVTIQPGQSPHNGEMHPDGDELLYVVSGALRVIHDSGQAPVDIAAGNACIVRQGEWHMVDCLKETTLMYITPGPNGEVRFD